MCTANTSRLYFPPTADDIKESQKPKIKDAKDQETMEEVFEDMSELDDDVDEKLKIANQTKAGDLIEEEEEKVMEKINTIPSTNEDTEVESPVKKKLKVEEETEKSEKVETSERTEKENEEKKNVEDVEKPTSDEESKKKAVEKDKTLSSDEEDWEKVEKD